MWIVEFSDYLTVLEIPKDLLKYISKFVHLNNESFNTVIPHFSIAFKLFECKI